MSDHITTRQSTVIPATVTSAAEGRGGRGRRKAATVACAALGALALAGGGFLAGAAVGQGDGATDVAYESVFFGSSSLGSSSGSSSAPGEEGGAEDAPADAPAGDGVADRSADAVDAESTDPAAAPEPEAGTGSGGRTGYAVRGDVIEIEGEDVLVCATGNGFGLSHIGVTLAAGADGDATRAESERLCADAFRVTGALVVGDPGGDLLATERDVRVGDRAYQCRPAAEKVLRCTADDGSMVTLWSAAP